MCKTMVDCGLSGISMLIWDGNGEDDVDTTKCTLHGMTNPNLVVDMHSDDGSF